MEYLEVIQEAINKAFDCTSTHIETAPVELKHNGEIMWEGEVEVFELTGNKEAKTAYGWAFPNGKQLVIATVLGISPINTPQLAVKAYLSKR